MNERLEEAGGEGPPRGAGGGHVRKSYTVAEKVALLKGYEDAGVGLQEFCTRQGVSTTSLGVWRKAYGKRGEAGLAPRSHGKRRVRRGPYKAAERQRALEAYRASGAEPGAFARLWGVTGRTLRAWAQGKVGRS